MIAVTLQEAIAEFLQYFSRSINRAKSETSKNSVVTVLIGHNAATFDTPVLLRNGGTDLAVKLQSMNIFFGDSLALMKALVKSSHPCLIKSADGTISKTNQTALYETLFGETFDAHDALEDVLALRKLLFCSKLDLSTETIIDNSSVISTQHGSEDMCYLDHRHAVLQSFEGKWRSTV